MTSNAFWVYGSAFKMGDGGSPEYFPTVSEVIDITTGFSRSSIEVTNQGSTSGWEEFIAGFRSGGVVTVIMNWLPTDSTQDGDTGLWEQFNDNENHNFQIVLPDAIATIAFTGHITGFPPTLPLKDRGQVTVAIQISGVVTIT
jgi:predicted secreted protein